jgi:hypothetical protein
MAQETRCPVHFSKVARVVPIDSADIELPRNIAIAHGGSREEKRADAIALLDADPRVNMVVLIERQREIINNAMQELRRVSDVIGRRLKTSVLNEGQDPAEIRGNINNYFMSRVRGKAPAYDPDSLAGSEERIAEFMGTVASGVRGQNDIALRNTEFTYVSNYKHPRGDRAFINGHVDRAEPQERSHDLREVECCQGSGTVLFDDNDFEIHYATPDQTQLSKVSLVNHFLTCWSLTPGSSVVIRVPSPRWVENGARPSVHAHGIGPDDGSAEERLTVRHDIALA